MEEPDDLTNITFCYGCLRKNEENTLHLYNIQNEALKALFQVAAISLCYLCKRRAQQAEMFIQNVQSNQLLLENFQNITASTLEVLRSQIQMLPLTSLTQIPLNTIELNGDSGDCEETFIVYKSWTKDDVKIKIEPIDEKQCLNHLEQFMDDNDDKDSEPYEPNIKEEAEDDYPLKLLKDELDLEGISFKCLRKSIKKGKVKKKTRKHEDLKKKDKTLDFRIETIQITREQCMEERAKMALDKQYLNSVYKCEDCLKGFTFKATYETHMKKHEIKEDTHFECDICKQRFNFEEKLHSHQNYHKFRYRCSICGLVRVTRLTIRDHYNAIHDNGFCQYSCPHCAKGYKRRAYLRKHISSVHTRGERVKCDYCNKTYVNKDVLKTHLLVKHPKQVTSGIRAKRYVCQDCGMAFRAPSQLRNHSMKHSQRKDYYCVECDKSFKSDTILKHHLKTAMPHINYLDLPLPCQHCDKRFSIKRDLDRHTNRVHLNIKPFQCDKCDRAYINMWSLKEHRRITHEGYKRPLRFPCPLCDKVFDRNQILKGHLRTHTGERPYQCSECPAQFSQSSILGTHVRLIHKRLTRDGRPKVQAEDKWPGPRGIIL